MPDVVLIHGNGGCTAADFWLPTVECELAALGLDVVNRTFPDNLKARARHWLPHLEGLGADANTVVIGHSSGAVAALRYAETHRLRGSVLVSVCHTDLGDPFERASGYYEQPWDWAAIRAHQGWVGIFHSTDDPHIPVAEPRFIAARLGASYFELEGRGHFADARPFPELVQFVRRKLGR
ncbi:MAG: RBBP9/YdeN family alpha/beta hydrolase [Vicinamibacterales bacterium]